MILEQAKKGGWPGISLGRRRFRAELLSGIQKNTFRLDATTTAHKNIRAQKSSLSWKKALRDSVITPIALTKMERIEILKRLKIYTIERDKFE
jgi:hypothetical protein